MQLRDDVRSLSQGRIPGLDGVRALSITLVLVSHSLIHSVGLTGSAQAVQYAYGEDGVVFFFCLSGFLITTLLLREHEQEGRISLGGFYLRRTLRIWPVWYLYLAVVAALAATGAVHVNARSWAGAATYLLNMVPGANSPALAHGWSLAIEEQFYLVWPLVLIWLLRRGKTLPVIAVLAFTAPIWRSAVWYGLPQVHQFAGSGTANRAGALLAGCLVAVLLSDPTWRSRYSAVVSPASVIGALAVVLVAPFLQLASPHQQAFDLTAGLSMSDLPLAFLVGAVVLRPDARQTRLLRCWPVILLGLMSYSLYVWQQVFLLALDVPLVPALLAAVLAGYLSWTFVERPSGRLKRLIELRKDRSGDRRVADPPPTGAVSRVPNAKR